MLCEISWAPIERRRHWGYRGTVGKASALTICPFLLLQTSPHQLCAMMWPFPGSLGWTSLSHLLFSKLAYLCYQIDCSSSGNGIVVMPGSYAVGRPRMASDLGSVLSGLLFFCSERNPESLLFQVNSLYTEPLCCLLPRSCCFTEMDL